MLDWCYRLAYRIVYPLADAWWRLRGHPGVAVAVWANGHVLAVRHSYKPGWRLIGGGINRRESHRLSAVRELREEVGIHVQPAQLRLVLIMGESRHGTRYLYEVRLDDVPPLHIDQREIIEAGFLPAHMIFEPDRRVVEYLMETAA